MTMNGGTSQQGRNGNTTATDIAIRQNQDVVSIGYRLFSGSRQLFNCLRAAGSAFTDQIGDVEDQGLEAAFGKLVDITQLGQIFIQ